MFNALVTFLRGLFKMGPGVLAWIGLLTIFNALIPLYYWPTAEAILCVVVFLAGFGAMVLVTYFFGFTRMLGLGHIFWIPLVIFFLFKIEFARLDQPFYLWMAGVITLNTISLVIDIADVARYIKGDKAPLVNEL